MADYGEGYIGGGGGAGGRKGSAGETAAEESHEVGGSKRGSKDSGGKQSKRRRSCPVYFGVKSYLHQFYDDGNTYKDPSLYEEDEDDRQFLLQPHQRRRRCAPIWWKIFMWIGVTLLLFGVIGILVGYLVPPRHVLIAQGPGPASPLLSSPLGSSNTAYIDERAEAYNTTLDMCKLIGLILFCVGGVTLAMALLFPSFLTHYCMDEDFFDTSSGAGKNLKDITGCYGRFGGSEVTSGEGQHLEQHQTSIPANTKVKEVQPTKKAGQQMLTHLPQSEAGSK